MADWDVGAQSQARGFVQATQKRPKKRPNLQKARKKGFSGFPVSLATTEWAMLGSNQRQSPCKGGALPLS